MSKAASFSAGCLNAVTYAHPQLVIIRNLVCFTKAPKLLTKQECSVHKKICRVQKPQKKEEKITKKYINVETMKGWLMSRLRHQRCGVEFKCFIQPLIIRREMPMLLCLRVSCQEPALNPRPWPQIWQCEEEEYELWDKLLCTSWLPPNKLLLLVCMNFLQHHNYHIYEIAEETLQ